MAWHMECPKIWVKRRSQTTAPRHRPAPAPQIKACACLVCTKSVLVLPTKHLAGDPHGHQEYTASSRLPGTGLLPAPLCSPQRLCIFCVTPKPDHAHGQLVIMGSQRLFYYVRCLGGNSIKHLPVARDNLIMAEGMRPVVE